MGDPVGSKLDRAEKEAEVRRKTEQIDRDIVKGENAPASINKQREKLSGQGDALAKTLNK